MIIVPIIRPAPLIRHKFLSLFFPLPNPEFFSYRNRSTRYLSGSSGPPGMLSLCFSCASLKQSSHKVIPVSLSLPQTLQYTFSPSAINTPYISFVPVHAVYHLPDSV